MHRRFRIPAFAVAALGLIALAVPAAPLSPHAGGGEGGRRANQSYLGVGLRDPSGKEASGLPAGTGHGTEVVSVDHDGPAGKAGLRENDLILQFNGQAISGHEQLKHLMHYVTPGQTVSLLILRDGQQMTVSATIETRQEVERRAWEQHIAAQSAIQPAVPSDATPAPADPPSMAFFHGAPSADGARRTHSILGTVLGIPYTGLLLEPVTPQLGEFFGVEGGAGLLVRSVDPNSPAMAAGLRAGDVVLRVNQVPIATESEWSREMHESKGRVTPILIVRDHHQQTLSLTPDPKRKSRLTMPASPLPLFPRQTDDVAADSTLAVGARLGT